MLFFVCFFNPYCNRAAFGLLFFIAFKKKKFNILTIMKTPSLTEEKSEKIIVFILK